MPCPEDSALLQSMINELASRHDAPVFPPHLTLHSGPPSSEEASCKLLESLHSEQVPKRMVATKLDFTSSYTMTLFLRCGPDSQLLKLHDFIRQKALKSEYHLDPHLSLLYADLPLSTKQDLANELAPPLEEIRFDRIRIVGHPSPVESQEDIADFQDLAEVIFHQHP